MKNSCGYQTKRPKPLWAEQNPESWWQAFKLNLRAITEEYKLSANKISITGIIGMGHGPVLVDRKGRSIFPCLIWPDLRAMKQAKDLRLKVKELNIERSIGSTIQGWYTAAKLLWIRERHSDIFNRVHKILLPKDYIRFKLTGNFLTDHTDAAGTQLYDIHDRNWIRELLDFLGISSDKLPDLCSMDEVAGEVTDSASEETGLEVGTKVMVGANDWGTIPMGLGTLVPGDGYIYLGTAPGFGVCIDKHIEENICYDLGIGCRPYNHLSGQWLLEGVLSVAGASLTWYIEQIKGKERHKVTDDHKSFEQLESEANQIKPGSEGLFFLPHLMGERFPENPNARAVLYGLSLGHTRAHIIRSMYEGIAFTLKRAIEIVEEGLDIKFKILRIFGGGVKSQLLTQILADILCLPLLLSDEEIGSLGLARVASTLLHKSCEKPIRKCASKRVEPRIELSSLYGGLYQLFRNIEERMSTVYNYSAKDSETLNYL